LSSLLFLFQYLYFYVFLYHFSFWLYDSLQFCIRKVCLELEGVIYFSLRVMVILGQLSVFIIVLWIFVILFIAILTLVLIHMIKRHRLFVIGRNILCTVSERKYLKINILGYHLYKMGLTPVYGFEYTFFWSFSRHVFQWRFCLISFLRRYFEYGDNPAVHHQLHLWKAVYVMVNPANHKDFVLLTPKFSLKLFISHHMHIFVSFLSALKSKIVRPHFFKK